MSTVLEKIRADMHTAKQKNGQKLVRSRRDGHPDLSPERREKAAQALEKYLPAAAQVWIDGLSACMVVYNGATKQYELSTIPDQRERRENAKALWENVVGKPVDRSLEVTGSYKELSVLIDEMRQSPEAQRLLGADFFGRLTTLQSNVEGKGETGAHEGETISQPEQKTG